MEVSELKTAEDIQAALSQGCQVTAQYTWGGNSPAETGRVKSASAGHCIIAGRVADFAVSMDNIQKAFSTNAAIQKPVGGWPSGGFARLDHASLAEPVSSRTEYLCLLVGGPADGKRIITPKLTTRIAFPFVPIRDMRWVPGLDSPAPIDEAVYELSYQTTTTLVYGHSSLTAKQIEKMLVDRYTNESEKESSPIEITIVCCEDRWTAVYVNGELQPREDSDNGYEAARAAKGRPCVIRTMNPVGWRSGRKFPRLLIEIPQGESDN